MTVERRRLKENIVILFIVGGLALNYPLLALANHLLLPLGISAAVFLYLCGLAGHYRTDGVDRGGRRP